MAGRARQLRASSCACAQGARSAQPRVREHSASRPPKPGPRSSTQLRSLCLSLACCTMGSITPFLQSCHENKMRSSELPPLVLTHMPTPCPRPDTKQGGAVHGLRATSTYSLMTLNKSRNLSGPVSPSGKWSSWYPRCRCLQVRIKQGNVWKACGSVPARAARHYDHHPLKPLAPPDTHPTLKPRQLPPSVPLPDSCL